MKDVANSNFATSFPHLSGAKRHCPLRDWAKGISMDRLLDLNTGLHRNGRFAALLLFLAQQPSRPVVWGTIDGCFSTFDSREEMQAVLRAATYALGLPLAEERRLQDLIACQPLVEFRTRHEHEWRAALYVGQRTEENDRAMRGWQKAITHARTRDEVGHSPGEPICLDPHPAFSAYN